jgi:hypothetical protein
VEGNTIESAIDILLNKKGLQKDMSSILKSHAAKVIGEDDTQLKMNRSCIVNKRCIHQPRLLKKKLFVMFNGEEGIVSISEINLENIADQPCAEDIPWNAATDDVKCFIGKV